MLFCVEIIVMLNSDSIAPKIRRKLDPKRSNFGSVSVAYTMDFAIHERQTKEKAESMY